MIVDQTGIVVAPGNPGALAEAWRKLIDVGHEVRGRLGLAARQRVEQNFALPAIVDRYQAIYAGLTTKRLQNVTSPKFSECAR
jgi:glycosyltransferase involved in cell wall biosynthesis